MAHRRGVRIVRGTQPEHLKAFYRLHLQTRRRQGVPIQPWRFFETLGRTMFGQGLGFVLLAYHEEECLAGAVFLHWRGTLTYKYSASSMRGLPLRPNALLLSTAIRWGCEQGYRMLDFGKSHLGNSGLRAFKSGWGATEVPLTYSFLSSRPAESGRARLLPLLQAVIRHSPAFVCRAAGQLFYKHFGC
jgi:lipid II:glycine glycyltransferase (peptidoglycan interpeptide bridge formation enzyme)